MTNIQAREKVVKYIKNYITAHINISVDYNLINDELNMEFFSLKEFLENFFGIESNADLIIQTINISDNYNLIFKTVGMLDDNLYSDVCAMMGNNKSNLEQAKEISKCLLKDKLIQVFGEDDKLDLLKEYDNFIPEFNDSSMQIGNTYFYWYNSKNLMKELLNRDLSYAQIGAKEKKLDINI